MCVGVGGGGKKNDRLVFDNYRGISLLSIPGKVFANGLLGRLTPVIKPSLLEEQCGFRPQKVKLIKFGYCDKS